MLILFRVEKSSSYFGEKGKSIQVNYGDPSIKVLSG